MIASVDEDDRNRPGTGANPNQEKPGEKQRNSADGAPLQQVRVSASTIEAVSKCALLVSVALYGIGLLIANFNAQLYGRYSLGLIEAQYVLVGLLWATLTLLGFAITRSATRWFKGYGPWKGRSLRENANASLWVLLGWIGLVCLYAQSVSFLGVENAFWSWVPWMILGVLLLTNLSLAALFKETLQDMNRRSAPGDSFLAKLWKADSIQISKRILYFFTALSLYSTFVFPRLSPAVGGGKLHEAEIVIRQDKRPLFDGLMEFRLNKDGKLGPVAVVAESEQSFVVTAPDTSFWKLPRRSLHLKKDLVELVIYTK